jgi:hypothetical protein
MKDACRELDSGSGDRSRCDEGLHRVLAGRGTGLPCAHCHELITADRARRERSGRRTSRWQVFLAEYATPSRDIGFLGSVGHEATPRQAVAHHMARRLPDASRPPRSDEDQPECRTTKAPCTSVTPWTARLLPGPCLSPPQTWLYHLEIQ